MMARKRAHNFGYRHYGWWDRMPTDDAVDPLRLANLLKEVDKSHVVTIEPSSADPSRYRSRCSRCPMALEEGVPGISDLTALLIAVRKHGRLGQATVYGIDLRRHVPALRSLDSCEISVLGRSYPTEPSIRVEALESGHNLHWKTESDRWLLGVCPHCDFTCQISTPLSLPKQSGGNDVHRLHLHWLLGVDELTPEVILKAELAGAADGHMVEIEENPYARRHNDVAQLIGEPLVPTAHISCSACDILSSPGWPAWYNIPFVLSAVGSHGITSRLCLTGRSLLSDTRRIVSLEPRVLEVIPPSDRPKWTVTESPGLPIGHQINWVVDDEIRARCRGCEFEATFNGPTTSHLSKLDKTHAAHLYWLLAVRY